MSRFRALSLVFASAALVLGVACGNPGNQKTVTFSPVTEAPTPARTDGTPTTTTTYRLPTTTSRAPTTTTTHRPSTTTSYRAPTTTTANEPPTSTTTAPYLSDDDYYTNVDGNQVHSPAFSSDGAAPSGATAQCRDGSYSFSQHRSGTCSGHEGVSRWL